MTDLRDRLRGIETAPPPDLWRDITARGAQDGPTTDATVVPFRHPSARRLTAGLVAAAIFVVGVVLVWRSVRTTPEPPPVLAPLPPGWVRCQNGVIGYTIGHPEEWFTTDILIGTRDPSFACRWFSPEPFDLVDDRGRPQGNVVTEGWAYPLEIGVGGPFDPAIADRTDPERVRLVSREDLLLDGHRAVRLEYETLFVEIGTPGLHTEYLVELDGERTLVLHTTETGGVPGRYEDNTRILDQAVETLSLADPVPGTLPAGWQRCSNLEGMFEVGYPADWYTTNVFFGDRRPEDACRFFAAVPFELETDDGSPMGVAVEEGCRYPVCIRFVPTAMDALAEELSDPERVQVVSREDIVINGRRAVVLDRVVDQPTLGEQEGPSFHYLIELGPRLTVLLTTEERDDTVGDGNGHTQQVLRTEDFSRNREVLEQMARTLILSPRT